MANDRHSEEITRLHPADAAMAARISEFAASEMFERAFKEGMALVEETAAYLDGPGRAESKRLSRQGALAYAGESMRLTTRLMQSASWLLVQRAVREGDMTADEAQQEHYRLSGKRDMGDEPFGGEDELPERLAGLIARAARLYDRLRRLDESIFGPSVKANPVALHLDRLRAVFEI
jgi:regulator of CtrA degradation